MTLLLLSTSPLIASSYPSDVSGQMLFRIYKGDVEQAFQLYLDQAQEAKTHDFHLLQQAGLQLLEQGMASSDAEIQLMCMFGAGVAAAPSCLSILEKGIKSPLMRTQLVALNYLGRLQDDDADLLLLEALSSPFLLTRLESCLQLAKKNHPATLAHLQSLLVKVPTPIRALFGQIGVHLDGAEGQTFMRQLLADSSLDVRIETLQAIAKENRDDFLPQIRSLASQAHFAQQESCAAALGKLKDKNSHPRLKEWSQSPRIPLRLTAAKALIQLGEKEALTLIEEEAKKGNVFAITLLGDLEEGKELLASLLPHPDRDVRVNAGAALFQMGDLSGLSILKEILFPGMRDLGVARTYSPGRGLSAWKVVPSASHHTKTHPGVNQTTMSFRENILVHALELPEIEFLNIIHLILEQKQEDLFPLAIELLQNRHCEKIVQLLKEGSQKTGLPLWRNYCALALYRLGVEGPYEQQLIQWVNQSAHTSIIRFQEKESDETNWEGSNQLSPEATSRFLVEAFETLASAQNEEGLHALIKAIAYGNPKNRYALAGLLIRTTE